MIWFVGIIVVVVLFVVLDHVTDAPIQRRRVNAGTDRYRAAVARAHASDRSISDIRVGAGDAYDPCATPQIKQAMAKPADEHDEEKP